jgi:hypothetical protein
MLCAGTATTGNQRHTGLLLGTFAPLLGSKLGVIVPIIVPIIVPVIYFVSTSVKGCNLQSLPLPQILAENLDARPFELRRQWEYKTM